MAVIPTIADARPRAVVRSTAHLSGAKAMAPWLVGVIPYGLVIGVTIGASSIGSVAGLATGAFIYSGSAQMAAIGMLDQGAAPVVVIAAVLAINARLLFYSGSIAVHWRGTSGGFRVLAAYLLVDPSYAVGKARYTDGSGPDAHQHYLGGAIVLWVAWHLAMVAGIVAGAGVPAALHLEYAVPLFLVAELMHQVRSRPAAAAAVVGGAVAVAGTRLPLHSGLVAAIVGGIAAACLVEGRS